MVEDSDTAGEAIDHIGRDLGRKEGRGGEGGRSDRRWEMRGEGGHYRGAAEDCGDIQRCGSYEDEESNSKVSQQPLPLRGGVEGGGGDSSHSFSCPSPPPPPPP